jgi:hypothetical protein
MNLNDLHRRLLADVLAIGTPYPLVSPAATRCKRTGWSSA